MKNEIVRDSSYYSIFSWYRLWTFFFCC